jgi:large-conductance mechanosensitive channel
MSKEEAIAGLSKKIIFGYIASSMFWNFYSSFYGDLLSPLLNTIVNDIFGVELKIEDKDKIIRHKKFCLEIVKMLITTSLIFLAYRVL